MNSRTTPLLLRRRCAAAVAAVALAPVAVVAAGSSTASATDAVAKAALTRRTVIREGDCRKGRGDWDLKVQRRSGGRLYVEFEVDEIPRGARWQLFLAHNGRRVAAVTRISRGPVLGVQVSRFTRNRAGVDRFRAAGVNPRSGSTCVGRLRF